MLKTLLLVGALLITSHAHALQLVPRWSFEKIILAREGSATERLFGMEVQVPLAGSHAMRIKPEVGVWFARSEGRKTSAYIAVQWGYQANTPIGLYVDAFIGPAFITAVDSQLGSHAQIKHDLGIGWMDQRGFGLGGGCTHFSDAGISGKANYGRDFCGARFHIPF